MIKLLENYMYGHAPEQPPVRSTLKGSATVTEYCERVHFGCNHDPSERNVTGCAMRCVPLKTPQTLRNYTLRVGPTADKTWPFDVFVYTPTASTGPLPFVVYNGEGFYSGVEFGDLTARGAKVLLDRGFGLALFNRNELRKDHKTGGCATAGCDMGTPDGVQTLYPDNDWSTINVWAWGAAHVLDFLLSDDTVCFPDHIPAIRYLHAKMVRVRVLGKERVHYLKAGAQAGLVCAAQTTGRSRQVDVNGP